MELRQLRYFIKAAELSNFTLAADALNISQSTMSQQIRQLESELKVSLFDRIAKRVHLTEAGSNFLPYAQRTVRESEEGKQMLNDLDDFKRGQLNIGVTYGLTSLLTAALVQFAAAYPALKIHIQIGTSEDLLALLAEGKVDFALSFMPVHSAKSVVAYPLFESVLSLIVHESDPLAGKSEIPLKEITSVPLVLPVKAYSIRSFLDCELKKNKLALDVSIEINDIKILLQLVETGKWSTILMKTSLFGCPTLRAIPIMGKRMVRQATITWQANIYRKKSALLFSEFLTNQ